ncbi:MAG: hypothetical protein SFW62_07520 [Alphaproteobacteria bacterium]|nr:hypothetical protein [Alphaproteobacteria bacterium]
MGEENKKVGRLKPPQIIAENFELRPHELERVQRRLGQLTEERKTRPSRIVARFTREDGQDGYTYAASISVTGQQSFKMAGKGRNMDEVMNEAMSHIPEEEPIFPLVNGKSFKLAVQHAGTLTPRKEKELRGAFADAVEEHGGRIRNPMIEVASANGKGFQVNVHLHKGSASPDGTAKGPLVLEAFREAMDRALARKDRKSAGKRNRQANRRQAQTRRDKAFRGFESQPS